MVKRKSKKHKGSAVETLPPPPAVNALVGPSSPPHKSTHDGLVFIGLVVMVVTGLGLIFGLGGGGKASSMAPSVAPATSSSTGSPKPVSSAAPVGGRRWKWYHYIGLILLLLPAGIVIRAILLFRKYYMEFKEANAKIRWEDKKSTYRKMLNPFFNLHYGIQNPTAAQVEERIPEILEFEAKAATDIPSWLETFWISVKLSFLKTFERFLKLDEGTLPFLYWRIDNAFSAKFNNLYATGQLERMLRETVEDMKAEEGQEKA